MKVDALLAAIAALAAYSNALPQMVNDRKFFLCTGVPLNIAVLPSRKKDRGIWLTLKISCLGVPLG